MYRNKTQDILFPLYVYVKALPFFLICLGVSLLLLML